jgi:hypothetical protein
LNPFEQEKKNYNSRPIVSVENGKIYPSAKEAALMIRGSATTNAEKKITPERIWRAMAKGHKCAGYHWLWQDGKDFNGGFTYG